MQQGTSRSGDIATGRLVRAFNTGRPSVRVALSPRDFVVATGSHNGVVRLWSENGTLLHTLRGHGGEITDLRFDAQGQRLVTASQGASRNAIMWDVRSGSRLHLLVGHFGTVTAASFSFDGRWIVTAGPISAGLIWPTDTGRRLFYLRGPTDLLTDAEWIPRSYRVVSRGTRRDRAHVRVRGVPTARPARPAGRRTPRRGALARAILELVRLGRERRETGLQPVVHRGGCE